MWCSHDGTIERTVQQSFRTTGLFGVHPCAPGVVSGIYIYAPDQSNSSLSFWGTNNEAQLPFGMASFHVSVTVISIVMRTTKKM